MLMQSLIDVLERGSGSLDVFLDGYDVSSLERSCEALLSLARRRIWNMISTSGTWLRGRRPWSLDVPTKESWICDQRWRQKLFKYGIIPPRKARPSSCFLAVNELFVVCGGDDDSDHEGSMLVRDASSLELINQIKYCCAFTVAVFGMRLIAFSTNEPIINVMSVCARGPEYMLEVGEVVTCRFLLIKVL